MEKITLPTPKRLEIPDEVDSDVDSDAKDYPLGYFKSFRTAKERSDYVLKLFNYKKFPLRTIVQICMDPDDRSIDAFIKDLEKPDARPWQPTYWLYHKVPSEKKEIWSLETFYYDTEDVLKDEIEYSFKNCEFHCSTIEEHRSLMKYVPQPIHWRDAYHFFKDIADDHLLNPIRTPYYVCPKSNKK